MTQDSKLVKFLKKWNENIDRTKYDMQKFALRMQGNDALDEGEGFKKRVKHESIVMLILFGLFITIFASVGFRFAWFVLLIMGIKVLFYIYDVLVWFFKKGIPKLKAIYKAYLAARVIKKMMKDIKKQNGRNNE